MAVQFLFINIATLLWAANVEPGYDKDGQVVTPSNSPSDWVDEGVIVCVAFHFLVSLTLISMISKPV